MFREFAVTIAVAIVVSGFVSLTLTPMLCARVLKEHDEARKPNIILRGFERMFESWLRAYEWALDRVLARKAMMLVVTLATLAGTVVPLLGLVMTWPGISKASGTEARRETSQRIENRRWLAIGRNAEPSDWR